MPRKRPSKRKVRKQTARNSEITSSLFTANRAANRALSKMNVKKDVASAVKKATTYQKNPYNPAAQEKMYDGYKYDEFGRHTGLKGKNKAAEKFKASVNRIGGMSNKMKKYNFYYDGQTQLDRDRAKMGQQSMQDINYKLDKAHKNLNAKKKQLGMGGRDFPLPPTSDKMFK
jgi:hypothetical protein